MAVTDKNILKSWFVRGKKPLAAQFAAWMDSYWHKDETIPIKSIDGLDEILAKKLDKQEIANITKFLMLERKYQLTMEKPVQDLFFAEDVTIYFAGSKNVKTLTMEINGIMTPIDLDTEVEILIPKGSVAWFHVERTLTDPTAYLYLFARVTNN
jgi:hypothetical protein